MPRRTPISHLARRVRDKAITRLGKPRKAGADLKIYEDDVFLVSYPRSGNTWMRFLLGGIIYGADVDFSNMEDYVPDMYRCTHSHLERQPRPRYIKSHEPYDPRYPQVIYLVRDPRDVAVSYHRWQVKFRKTTSSLTEFVEEFVTSGSRYGTWGDHVDGWLDRAAAEPGSSIVLRYEDLVEATGRELARLAGFLGIEVDPRTLHRIIESNQLEEMKVKEEKATGAEIFRGTRDDVAFIGDGPNESWKSTLGQGADRIVEVFGDVMRRVGYTVHG